MKGMCSGWFEKLVIVQASLQPLAVLMSNINSNGMQFPVVVLTLLLVIHSSDTGFV